MAILAYVLSSLPLLMSILFFVRLRVVNLALFAELAAGALSPIWAIMGIIGAVMGWTYQFLWAIPLGLLGAGIMVLYVWRCARDHKGFEKAFGVGWSHHIPPEQTKHMVQKRWTWFLNMKASPSPIWERDIPFSTVPDTERELLCDIWRPRDRSISSLAFVFFHGGGWFAMDKDFGTRPFFSHLVAQGHTVMDVAYRLCPEVDIYGIVGDVKRAIAWMKTNASRYGVNPEKIALGGGSVGGHLALLAAYTHQHPELTPEDIRDADLSVCGVVSYYGPSDLRAGYDPWRKANPFSNLPSLPIGTMLEPKKRMNYAGRLDILLGGNPQEIPDTYQLTSPISHVHPGCPPTLLIQGDKDLLVALDTTCALYAKLVESGVEAINVIFPWTEHGFDLAFPQINPAAQSALYDVDRFLALLLNRG